MTQTIGLGRDTSYTVKNVNIAESVLEGMSLPQLKAAYDDGTLRPTQTIEWIKKKINKKSIDEDWTYVIDFKHLNNRAKELESIENRSAFPLYGIPFSVKDNIHVAGIPTRAGSNAYSYLPNETAAVAQAFIDAGAILIGKNTMDEFATGVVGTRSSPHPVNPFNERYISGGSSSGSAVVVSNRQVCFALGTDTGGSGRVPAALCNIVGYKPTPTLFGNNGLVYANRSIDCIPFFTKTVDETLYLFDVLSEKLYPNGKAREIDAKKLLEQDLLKLRIAVPDSSTINFFGDSLAQECFDNSVSRMKEAGFTIQEIDISAFVNAGKRLFDGPMLNERFQSINTAVNGNWASVNPTVREVVSRASDYNIADLWAELYAFQDFHAKVKKIFCSIDLLLTPTTGTIYTIDEVNKNPIQRNADMAYYTSFGNILHLSIISVPAGFRRDRLPFGLSIVGKSRSDGIVLQMAKYWETLSQLNA